jgi:hypothetical protein
MKITKKDVRKITSATEAELEKLKQEYEVVAKNIGPLNNTALIMLCVVGIAALFYFGNGFFEFIGFLGFILFVYAFYTLANRIGHREGYFDGYYEASHQKGDATPEGKVSDVIHKS